MQELFEGRTNVMDQLRPYRERKDLFIQFSDILKLGINPMTPYNETPLGVYAYPISTIFSDLEWKTVPFASDRKYIHLIRGIGNIIDINNVPDDTLFGYFTKLRDIVSVVIPDKEKAEYHLSILDMYFKRNHPLWRLSHVAARAIENSTGRRKEVVWNGLYRHLGIDGLIDWGEGTIHTHERSQAVFMSTKSCQLISTYINDHLKFKPNEE